MLAIYRQLYDLLDRAERRQLALLLLLVIGMALVDMVGVAAVLPFLAVAADPAAARGHWFLAALYEASGVTSDHAFVLLLGLLVVGFLLLGLAVKLAGQFRIVRFGHQRNHSLSLRLMQRYMQHPYVWFLNRNSANLGAAILSECDRVVGSALLPALRILAHGVTLLFLFGLLVAVSPGVALAAVLGVGGAYAAVFLLVRRRLTRLGQSQIAANRARYRIAQEAFGGIKDVKLMGLEAHYAARYEGPSRESAMNGAASQVIGELPRFVLEALAFSALVLAILGLMLVQDARLAEVLPVLGVFGFAVLKMFPAVQNIYHSLTQIRFAAPMLAKLHGDLCGAGAASATAPEAPPPAPLPLHRAITLDEVRFAYPSAARPSLDGLSLTIPVRSTVGLVGGTGAGKTTAVDLILGLLEPDAGQVLVDGVPMGAANRAAWQRSLGYVPQAIFLSDESVAANIAFGIPPETRDMAAVERAARLAELHDFILRDLPQGYDTPVGERGVRLSGGQRQRIGIARALYRDPAVLILDEATSALDNLTERAVMDAVANLAHAKTIIMIAHRLTTVKACDTIFLLEDGRLAAQGTFDELVARSETFRRMAS
jgi:ABC-type multidrug transport system fused ATPase/permease subunit